MKGLVFIMLKKFQDLHKSLPLDVYKKILKEQNELPADAIKVGIYLRVSTKLQEDNYSLPTQFRELVIYANNQRWKIVTIIQDVGSGKKLDKEGLNTLLDFAEDGKIDIALVFDQDRLSRLEPVDWEFLKSILAENNVKIAEPGNITDLANEDHVLMSDMKNSYARFERRKFMRRSMRNKKQRLRSGKAWGGVHYGEYTYNKETGTYFAKDEWRWIIPFIDELYLSDTMGMNAIAQELNKISPSPSGKRWTEQLVFRRLASKVYHGIEEIEFKDGEIIIAEGVYESLRTLDTYNKIQDIRRRRKGQYKITSRQKRDIHPLRRTKLKCGLCNMALNISQSGQANAPHYYIRHGRKLRTRDGHHCTISINTLRFMDNIIDAIQDLLTGGEVARKYLNLEIEKENVQELKDEIQKQKRSVNDAKTSLDRLLDLYLSGDLPKDKFKTKEKELNNKISTLEKQLQGNSTKLNAIEKDNFAFNAIHEYLGLANNLSTDLTPLELANLIGTVFPNGAVFEDKLIMETNLKGIPFEIEIPINPTGHYTKTKSYVSDNNQLYMNPASMPETPAIETKKRSHEAYQTCPRSDSKTGITGVSEEIKNGKIKYCANITIRGKRHFLGRYDDITDAIKVRKEAEEKYRPKGVIQDIKAKHIPT